jgi:DNA-3-methyladenine glycosylase I
MTLSLKRCWNTESSLHVKYHDEEWGVPLHDDKKLFEFLILEGFQAGLSWSLILERRNAMRKAFDGFDPSKIAKYSEKDTGRLMETPGVIKNKPKILAAINNAQRYLEIKAEFGTFDRFIWKFVGDKPINNQLTSFSQMPAETEQSKAMSKELKRRGFKFVGPTICYSFMQAVGLVNDHLVWCFRYKQVQNGR